MDDDLEAFGRDELIAEVERLRHAIREHRDSSLHELCWHHPKLWGLLPEKSDPQPVVPAWPQFLQGCIRYRQSVVRQNRVARLGEALRHRRRCRGFVQSSSMDSSSTRIVSVDETNCAQWVVRRYRWPAHAAGSGAYAACRS